MWAPDELDGLSVEVYLTRWLDHIKGRVRPKTFEGYEALVRVHALPNLGALPIAGLTALGIQDLYSKLLNDSKKHLSAGTVLNLHLVLTNAFGQAVRWGLLAANPAAGAQPPRPRRAELQAVDPKLAERILLVASGTRFELPVAIAISTGMRRGEILALRWADLEKDLSAAHVRRTIQPTRSGLVVAEPKTKRSRRAVEFPAFLRPYLERQRTDQTAREEAAGVQWAGLDLVIDRGDGHPVNPDSLSSGWFGFCRRRGLPHVRFHDLRHAHATLMLLQGVHPKVVSERLGHASVGITLDVYSHVLPAMQTEAVRAFDDLFPGQLDRP